MVRDIENGVSLIEKWLRNKNTIEFLGIWKMMYNEDFNSPEFEGIKNEAGTNRFLLSVKQWIEKTNAKGIVAKEKQKEQSLVVKLSGLMFLAGFIVAGLGVRFNWYILPTPVVIVATVLFLIAYLIYAEVLRENTYLSRTIEVQENQKVIDTGLYGIVRHPMYSATLLLFLSMPIVLGSVYSFLIFLAYPFIIAKRIKAEEEFLEKELSGYSEYKKKVKYRLIPFIW